MQRTYQKRSSIRPEEHVQAAEAFSKRTYRHGRGSASSYCANRLGDSKWPEGRQYTHYVRRPDAANS